MTLQELKSGESFFFNNELWCESNESDDVRQATVLLNNSVPNWAHGFQLWFNGELLHSCKTFQSLKNRLDKLVLKWNLEECEEL